MPSVVQEFKTGPRTYPAVEPIVGGQLVEARAGTGVGVAAAGSFVCVGVALDDASNTGTAFGVPVTAATVGGYPVLPATATPVNVAVVKGGIVAGITYAAAATFGQALICAAAGQVTPAGATPDARTVIGYCEEIAGVAAAGKGRVHFIR